MREALQHTVTQQDIADMKPIHSRLEQLTPMVFEAGKLLKIVRDRKLYLIYADSLKEYVESVLGWCRQRGYQAIDAYDVKESLPDEVSTIVDTETKARALKPIPPAQRPKVLQQAAKEAERNGTEVTARSITQAAQQVVKHAAQEPIDVEEILYDKTGFRVPSHHAALFKRSTEVTEMMRKIAEVRGAMRRIEGLSDPLYKFVGIKDVMAGLDQAYYELKMAIPHVVCPYCQGQVNFNCTACKTVGFMPEHTWKHAVPEDLKAVRAKSCVKK